MPALAHLQEADINALYAYLTSSPVPPMRHRSRARPRAGPGSASTSSRAPATSAMMPSVHVLPDRRSRRGRFRRLRRCSRTSPSSIHHEGPKRRARHDGNPAFHYRGRMPVFPFLQDVEVAAAYMFLVDYPPQAGDSGRQ